MKTQNEAILDHLKSGQAITPLLALDMFGTMRLASRIGELRDQGYAIKSERIKVPTRIGFTSVSRYSL